MKSKQLKPEIFKRINETIFESFYEKQKASSLDEISIALSLPRAKVSEYIQIMEGKKQLHKIFSGKGQPTLYIPMVAIKEMMKLEPKPKWIANYLFPEKDEVNRAIENRRLEIDKYESFERILYGHDKTLESSLATIFNYLSFNNVVYTEDPQKHDIEFTYNDCLYVIEAKGKTGQADKDDVLQLRGWIDMKLEEGIAAESLMGMLIVNNHRHTEPGKRSQEAFTEKAKQFLKMNKFIYASTFFLYKLLKQTVEGKIDIGIAREKFIKGEELT